MQCEDIRSVLDLQRTAALTAAERSAIDGHLAECERCADQWLAHQAVASEFVSGPRPGLFAAIVGGVRPANLKPAPRQTTAPWICGVGIAAAIALAAVAWWSLVPRRVDAPPAVVADSPAADAPARFERFRNGVHYTQLATAPPAGQAGAGEIEIDEFFMYSCYHCYELEFELERWRASLPADTKLVRVPAIFGPVARLHAQAFYTAAALGKSELHAALYEEIHRKGDPLDSETALEALFGRFGVDSATFRTTFVSTEVQVQVQHAEALNREYRISAAPSLVVDRRFLTSPGVTGSTETMLAVVDELVTKERERRRVSDVRGTPAEGPRF